MNWRDGMPVLAGWNGEDPMITVCAGAPKCRLQGEEAIARQNAGCLDCRRIVVTADGEREIPPPTRGTA